MERNLALCLKFYPDWDVHVYCDKSALDYLVQHQPMVPAGQKIPWTFEFLPDDHWCPRMMQRFLIADDPTVERFCSRDSDSRIMQREVDAVNAWISDDKILHVMRDNKAHCQEIMGGMFGLQCKRDNWAMPSMERLIREFLSEPSPYRPGEYMADQSFLAHKIWGWARWSSTQHSSVCLGAFPGSKRFPAPRQDPPRFVGEVMDIGPNGEDVPREGDLQHISDLE